MDSQRLRNMTTMKLHTDISCVYEDLETITGERGIMTHMIPRIMRSIEPWLREHVVGGRFWNGKYDPTHTCLLYTSPSPRDGATSRMPSSA